MRICDYQDPKGVRRENLRQPGGGQAPLEHALEGVRREGLTGEGTVSLLVGAKRPRVLGPANRPFVQVTVHGDLPDPSSFFRKLQRPVAVIPQILDPESEDSPGPGARIDECPQYCPFEMVIEDGRFKYARREEAIEREAQLDGFYIIRTSEPEERLTTDDAVRNYKNLTNVERAFRSLKAVDLQIRPIRHRTEERVRSHLFLCLLSYYVEWHLRRALAPLPFDDEYLDAHRAKRDPVRAAQPSASAKRKKSERTTEDGLPIHSFATLMAELGTRARHQCRVASDPEGPRLQRLTEATRLQKRAMELVQTFPVTTKSSS